MHIPYYLALTLHYLQCKNTFVQTVQIEAAVFACNTAKAGGSCASCWWRGDGAAQPQAFMISLRSAAMPPKRKRPAEAQPIILHSNSEQEEVLAWLRHTVKLPSGILDKVSSNEAGRPTQALALLCPPLAF